MTEEGKQAEVLLEELGPLVEFGVVQRGTSHEIPLRGVSYGVDTVRSVLRGRLNPDLPLVTLRFKGETYVLTLKDLKLAE